MKADVGAGHDTSLDARPTDIDANKNSSDVRFRSFDDDKLDMQLAFWRK